MHEKNLTGRGIKSGGRAYEGEEYLKVLLLATRVNLGGIGVYTLSLAKALKARGIEPIIASSGGELLEDIRKQGIEHIYIPVDTSADIGLHTLIGYFRLSRIVKDNAIDIIHAQTRVTQLIAALLSRRFSMPYITTCHGFFKKRLFRRFFPCWGYRSIAISDAVRQHLVYDMNVTKDRIRLIYNGIDITRFNRQVSLEDKAHIRKEYKLKDLPTIGIVSRLSEVKGHRYLLGAFSKILRRFPDTQLLIVGDGKPRYLEYLKSIVDSLSIQDKVIFHPSCRDTYIPLSVIDIFCMPSVQEGLGLSIIEAMASGVVVVASDVGGIYSLIKDGENGFLVNPKDEEGIAEAIISLLLDKHMARKMADRGRSIANERFTLDIMTEKVISVYKELIKKDSEDE